MNHKFDIIMRTFENNSLVVFIDLLGTSKLWESDVSTEDQAEVILSNLLKRFDITFSECFEENEREESFDISIFADSIVISQRKNVKNIVERLVDFSLKYQVHLFLNNNIQSVTTILRGGFFSFKLINPAKTSIFGSKYTSVSLCGGRGIIAAHKRQKDLPMGVYVDKIIIGELSEKQANMVVPVKNDPELLFVKSDIKIISTLPDKTIKLLCNHPNARAKTIEQSLYSSNYGKEAVNKIMPWILVHLRNTKYVEKYLGLTKR